MNRHVEYKTLLISTMSDLFGALRWCRGLCWRCDQQMRAFSSSAAELHATWMDAIRRGTAMPSIGEHLLFGTQGTKNEVLCAFWPNSAQ
jgi:hypothetical protein